MGDGRVVKMTLDDNSTIGLVVDELTDMYAMVNSRETRAKDRKILEHLIAVIRWYMTKKQFAKWKKENLI